MKVKFYVGSSCGGNDIVNDNANSKTHGPFSFNVTAGQTYHVRILKQSSGYMRYSLTYSFTKTIVSNTPNISIDPTSENIAPATASVSLDVRLSEAANTGDITVDYTDCDGSAKSVTIAQGDTTQSISVDTSGLTNNGDSCQVKLNSASGNNGQQTGTITPDTSTIIVASNAPDISIDPTSKSISVGTTSTTLDIKLSEAANTGDLTVSYTDCAGGSGSATVTKGDTVQSINIDTSSLTSDGDSCTVQLTGASGQNGQQAGALAPDTATITAVAIPDETVPNGDANATEAVCMSFEDVLQTRDDPSDIHHKSGASANVYDNPDCTLNTSDVDFGSWQHLRCEQGGDMSASGTYGTSLSINYSNTPDSATVSANPSASSTSETVTISKTLTDSQYNKVEIGSGSTGNLNVTFSSLNAINTLNFTTDNTVSFSAPTPYNLEIGSVGIVNNGSGNTLQTSTIPKNIKINTFSLPGKTTIDFEAEQTIKMQTLEIGRAGTSVKLKAQYVQINTLHQTNSYGGSSNVEIVADYVDIGTLDLDEEATITFKPYTPGKRILFRANSISASSSSTMVVSSGNYYTGSFDIPGSSNVSSIHAIDSSAVINMFIDGDFKPGNNPGINSDGNDGNFGSLPASNFFFFVNGDLETGGGGTTFNATVYVEGSTDFGSPSYLKGALSSGGDIEIGNSSKFYYSQDTSAGWGECASSITYQNNYSCGMFNDPITTYETLHIGDGHPANNVEVCNSAAITYKNHAGSNTAHCNPNGCGGANACDQNPPPPNKLTYTVYDSSKLGTSEPTPSGALSQGEYGDFNGNFDLTLTPAESYPNNSNINVMLLGDVSLTGNGNTLSLEPGDYYFHSLEFTKNNPSIVLPNGGPVRLFIKENFTVGKNGLNINASGSADDLLIYVEGSVDFETNGNLETMKAFLYAKGDIKINANSANFDVTGGITAEGDIWISGNNPTFRAFDASDLGYGECQMCYDDIKVGGMSMNFFNCGGFSFMRDIKVPIFATDTVTNASVDEAHDASMFSFSFMGTNNVLDENGNVLRNATTISSGWNAGAMGMDMSLFGGKAISYPLDDPYGPADANNGYNQLHSSSLFSMGFNPCDWYQSLVYVAHYDDGQKHYDVQLEKCEGAGSSVTPTYVTGPFDAWDTFRGDTNADGVIDDRNISTKIAGKPFDLNISSTDATHTLVETKPGVETVYYRLAQFDTNGNYTNDLSNFFDFNVSTTASLSHTFTIDKAVKAAVVVFRFCADYNGTVYTLYPDVNCSGATVLSESDLNQVGWRESTSSDAFAIRPKAFDVNITNNQTFVAMTPLSLQFLALDYNGTADGNPNNINDKTADYNESEGSTFEVDLNLTDPAVTCQFTTADITPTVTFTDGVYTSNSLKIDHVGDFNLTIHEKEQCTSRYASIDCDDNDISGIWTQDDNLSIEPKSLNVNVTPDHFTITGDYKDAGNNFTYLSNLNETQLMYSLLDINITAEKANGTTAENYTNGCYAKGTTITVNYLPSSGIANLSNIQFFEERNTTVSEKNIDGSFTMSFTPTIFSTDHNGTAELAIDINFDRDKTLAVNPFEHEITQITVTDGSVTTDIPLNKKALFIYGRAHAPRFRTANSSGSLPVTFQYYYDVNPSIESNTTLKNALTPSGSSDRTPDGFYWYKNNAHQSGDGNITAITYYNPDGNSDLTLGYNIGVTNGIQYFNYTYNGNDYPYRATIKISSQPWLIYDFYNQAATIFEVPLEINNANVANPGSGADSDVVDTTMPSRGIVW